LLIHLQVCHGQARLKTPPITGESRASLIFWAVESQVILFCSRMSFRLQWIIGYCPSSFIALMGKATFRPLVD